MSVTQNTNDLIELKERYEIFEKNIFDQKFSKMTEIKEELDEKMQSIQEMNQTTRENLEKSIAQSKQIQLTHTLPDSQTSQICSLIQNLFAFIKFIRIYQIYSHSSNLFALITFSNFSPLSE